MQEKRWDFRTSTVLAKKLDNAFNVNGPRIINGYFSHVFKEDESDDNKNKQGLDWIISSTEIDVNNKYPDSSQSPKATYDWSFVSDCNGYIGKTKDDYLGIRGLPDHAILKGMINL